ncbi:hypothetical protein ACFQMA_23935 [Halosimplex aquaticum]|uniref:Uncharacterized protein n=1 Tax=Halosimplex aquaticum TaxID=3026162 RepID=A0ABD5Y969_9EURY|nr:hypothetical protein [Halosimplex aquaticum]
MSLWRSKRRYETGRHISDQADDALYALALLQSDGSVTRTRADELRDNLEAGKAVLRTLRDALEHPEKSDNFAYTLARQLREHYGDINKYAIERLNRHLDLLGETKEDLEYRENLTEVIETLELVEELATRTTDQDAEQLRDYVAHSDH